MFTTRPELLGTHGMVASTHWLASAVGMSVLERGGNAVDAAVAAGFVLQVVEPHLNGPGGDVPILFAAPSGQVESTAARGRRPPPRASSATRARARPRARHRPAGRRRARAPSARGRCCSSARAPGGCATCSSRPSPTPSTASRCCRRRSRRSRPSSRCSASSGRPPPRPGWLRRASRPPGSLWRNPALAATYRRVLDEAEAAATGREAAGRGGARRLLPRLRRRARSPSSAPRRRSWTPPARRHRGLLDADDLARWEPTVEPPVSVDYAGVDRAQDRRRGGRARCCCSSCGCSRASTSRPWATCRSTGSTPSPSAPSSPSPTARPGTPTPTSSTSRWTTLLSSAYAAERRALVGADGVVRPAPRQPGRAHAACCPRRRRPAARVRPVTVRRRRRADGARRRAAPAATPATSTSSTGTGAWSRRRRAAAGCRARRPSPRSASASAPGRR